MDFKFLPAAPADEQGKSLPDTEAGVRDGAFQCGSKTEDAGLAGNPETTRRSVQRAAHRPVEAVPAESPVRADIIVLTQHTVCRCTIGFGSRIVEPDHAVGVCIDREEASCGGNADAGAAKS